MQSNAAYYIEICWLNCSHVEYGRGFKSVARRDVGPDHMGGMWLDRRQYLLHMVEMWLHALRRHAGKLGVSADCLQVFYSSNELQWISGVIIHVSIFFVLSGALSSRIWSWPKNINCMQLQSIKISLEDKDIKRSIEVLLILLRFTIINKNCWVNSYITLDPCPYLLYQTFTFGQICRESQGVDTKEPKVKHFLQIFISTFVCIS